MKRGEEDFEIKDVKSLFLGEEQKNKKVGLFEYFDRFLVQKAASNKRKTLSEYTTVINDLKEYKIHYKEKLTLDKLGDELLSKYLKMLYEENENVTNTSAMKVSKYLIPAIQCLLNEVSALLNNPKVLAISILFSHANDRLVLYS